MQVYLDTKSIADYETFLKVKSLPIYSFNGHVATFPDEYASMVGIGEVKAKRKAKYKPSKWAFDYQRDIAEMAIERRKFAIFAKPGMGKTVMLLEWGLHVRKELPLSKNVLFTSPLMVIDQTIEEANRFYGDYPIEFVPASKLQAWVDKPQKKIGITNYEALRPELTRGCLGALAGDETSMMKSMYGTWGLKLIELGKGLEWKLCMTGTPAPNDRIEYGNHAVFLDHFPTLNAFLAKYFVNRGQTSERWELKRHALEPFYRSLSHWCIFLTNPAVYGWKDNTKSFPPINVHIHHVELTDEQNDAVGKQTGQLFATDYGGITSRGTLARIAKGTFKGEKVETLKPAFIESLVSQWPTESSIIWCKYNDEQDTLASMFPDCANIDGSTPHEKRMELIREFKSGERKRLISKPKVLGFGLNLQIATKMVFSTIQDSYEEYYQAVCRANRYGSTMPLDVHLPLTELEIPMAENVLRKARMIEEDTAVQEAIFRKESLWTRN